MAREATVSTVQTRHSKKCIGAVLIARVSFSKIFFLQLLQFDHPEVPAGRNVMRYGSTRKQVAEIIQVKE